MKTNLSAKITILTLLLGFTFLINARAQEYVSPTKPPLTGRSPGVKVKLVSQDSKTKTYCIIFSPGDEIMSGLKEFAIKYHVTSAHFTGIGDAKLTRFGWYDAKKKLFRVNHIDQFTEVTSLMGDVSVYNGNPVVHAHVNLATEDGIVHGGHLFEGIVSPTLQVMMTVEPVTLYKKLDVESGILVIDPVK